MLCGVVAIFISRFLPFSGSLLSGIMCGLIYLALAFASGGISVIRIQNFIEEMHGFRAGVAIPTAGGEL